MTIKERAIIIDIKKVSNSSAILDLYGEKSGYIKGLAFRIMRPVNIFYIPLYYLAPVEIIHYGKKDKEKIGKIREMHHIMPKLFFRNDLSYFIMVESTLWKTLLAKNPPDSSLFEKCISLIGKICELPAKSSAWIFFSLEFLQTFINHSGIQGNIFELSRAEIESLFATNFSINLNLSLLFDEFEKIHKIYI